MFVFKVMGYVALAIMLIVVIVYVICILIDTFDDVSSSLKRKWRKRSEFREEREKARRMKAEEESGKKMCEGFCEGAVLRKWAENPYDESRYALVLSERTNLRGAKYVEVVPCDKNGDYDSGSADRTTWYVNDLYESGYRVERIKK